MQLMAYNLGGQVKSDNGQYGRAEITVTSDDAQDYLPTRLRNKTRVDESR